ncbi:hypothetical protein [Streptomyces sp. NPDC053755]|uniref:hypothetical protein n=1 Tax=Streptomyces sp. NPDC053755 TaxID=3155815 RepID=UPI0034194E6B
MRLRNALALGVTAATTGTAVLALTAGPAPAAAAASLSAEPGPGAEADPGAGPGVRPDAAAPRPPARLGADSGPGLLSGADSGSGLLSGTGTGLLPGRGTGTAPGLLPGTGAGTRPGVGTGTAPDAGATPGPGPGGGSERRDTPPTCGKESDPDFPLDTRIHGGPGVFVPGGPVLTWNLDLTNTTTESCHSIHPVLALTDRDRTLQPAQITLEFHDSEADLWRPVPFEGTDQDENIGVFADFSGFSVPAGGTVTVPVRLAFRAGTAPNEVVANAAVVQRNGDDGDWVGRSDDYRFRIAAGGEPADREPESTKEPEPTKAPDPPAEPKEQEPHATEKAPETPSDSASDGAAPSREGGHPTTRPLPELARTGGASDRALALTLAPFSGALLLTGAALTATTRRRRPAVDTPPVPATGTRPTPATATPPDSPTG